MHQITEKRPKTAWNSRGRSHSRHVCVNYPSKP